MMSNHYSSYYEELERWGYRNRRSYSSSSTDTQTINEDSTKTETPPLDKKIKDCDLKSKTLFSKVGVEPTFYPNIIFPDKWMQGDRWVEVFEGLIDKFTNDFKSDIKFHWMSKAHSDDDVLEIPTPDEYKTLPSLLKDYKRLLDILKEYGFSPSSLIQRDSEGGCHVNFDLQNRIDLYDQDIVEKFCVNVINFLNKYPSLTWACLAPEDNESSELYTKLFDSDDIFDGVTEKGNCVNVRDEDTKYIELRLFMMPRTVREFALHINVGNNLLKYVWNKTIKAKKVLWTDLNKEKDFKKYTIVKAKKELNKVLSLLKISKREMNACDKFQMLEERFKLGKNYLT